MTLQHPVMFLFMCASLLVLSLRFLAPWRAHAFLLLSVAFVALQHRFAVPSLVVLAGAVVVHYATLRSMIRLPETYRAGVFWSWLVLTLVGFAVVKHYDWLTHAVLPRTLVAVDIVTIGFSFLLFRQIHLSIEVRDGTTASVPILEYLNYNLAFWTFLAGPIQRFESFCVQFDRMSEPERCVGTRALVLALNRVMTGFIKMFLVAPLFERYAGADAFVATPNLPNLAALLLAFPLYLYVNFSGYCDIVIGLARVVGFELPENFRHPYLARTSIEFWNRWHITLSEFFRDYQYFPLFLALARRRVWPWMATGVATLCSFAVMGAWHGNRPGFVIFGLLHGAAVLVALAYDALLRAALAKETLARYQASRVISALSVLCFQGFVVLSFLPFQFSNQQLRSIVHALRALVSSA
jgi:D-alanyl-lipoteichoic acid acyltransferase DltB (MBOAT superfamily)